MSVREYAAKARIVKAMAHPARLLVVEQLSQHGEQCVCELTRTVGTDMSTVSRHLSVLKNAGIIADEKRGAQVFYRLAMDCAVGFLRCVDTLIEQMAEPQRRLPPQHVAGFPQTSPAFQSRSDGHDKRFHFGEAPERGTH